MFEIDSIYHIIIMILTTDRLSFVVLKKCPSAVCVRRTIKPPRKRRSAVLLGGCKQSEASPSYVRLTCLYKPRPWPVPHAPLTSDP